MSGTISQPTADGLNMIVYMTGLTATGTLQNTNTFWTYFSSPSAVTARSWGSGTTITYGFDPASNYTDAEKGSYIQGMSLWAAEANINFVQATTFGTATLTYTRSTDKGSSESDNLDSNPTNGTTAPAVLTSASIKMDTNSGYQWDNLSSYTVNGGGGPGTIIHELAHALGLGHPGPYNGGSPLTQLYSTDTTQYSLMSYINASSTSGGGNSIPYPSTVNWDFAGVSYSPTTPMLYDIAAVQRIYGVPVSTPLSGGQTFGFNTTTGLTAFDFNVNLHPVVTLWDAGTGNILDLSGFTADTSEIINLNPGTYSSVAGLTQNLGIAFGTQINTLKAGAGTKIITVNNANDIINGGTGSATIVFGGNRSSWTLSSDGNVITARNGEVTDSLSSVRTLQFADQSIDASSVVACYVRGTHIKTARGEVAVEDLIIGDRLMTLAGDAQPLLWIGRRSYAGWLAIGNPDVQPIRFAAGSLADHVPCRDLLVSPEHAMFLDGMLIPAHHLVNGVSIHKAAGMEEVHYFHLELADHAVIFAEDAAAESFVDDNSRGMFHNAYEFAALYPNRSRWVETAFCAPRVEDGFELAAVQQMLKSRAIRLQANGKTGPARVLQGFLETVNQTMVEGWAAVSNGASERVGLVIWDNGTIIGRAVADRYRADLEQRGIGDGRHGFRFMIPQGFSPAFMHVIEVRCESDGTGLLGGSVVMEAQVAPMPRPISH